MSNSFFGNNMSKLDKIKLAEFEAQELAQDCREEELAAWAELHGARQNSETGEWEV